MPIADGGAVSRGQRIELMAPVCEGVHMPSKGVIHRDIKPSNIQVAEGPNVPVPKRDRFVIAES